MKNDNPIRFDWAAMNESYHNSMMWSSYQEGRLKGIEEGGEEKELTIIQDALRQGFDLEIITRITDLPINKIMQIQREMKSQSKCSQ